MRHLATNQHKKAGPQDIPAQPTEAETRDWLELFRAADEELQNERLLELPKPAPPKPAPKPSRPAAEARPSNRPSGSEVGPK